MEIKYKLYNILNKEFILNLFFFITISGFCQETATKKLNDFPYPAGLYENFIDFQSKIPSKQISFTFTKSQTKNAKSTGFQLRDTNGKKIKNAFAVCDGKNLFVSVKYMQKYFQNKNKSNEINGNPNDNNRDYSLAHYTNNNYVYFENYFSVINLIGFKIIRLKGILFKQVTGKFLVFNYNQSFKDFLKEKTGTSTDNYSQNFRVKSDSLINYLKNSN